MRVAYLINQYPHFSHSFLSGAKCSRLSGKVLKSCEIALRGWDGPIVDEADILSANVGAGALRDGAWPLLLATLQMFLLRRGRSAFGAH